MSEQKVIMIGGPTASGKSSFALSLAKSCQGTIINADALQIYAGMPILSAQPLASAREAVPHELYAVTDAAEASSVGTWLALAVQSLEQAWKEKRQPILVGGTGMYFQALIRGLAATPTVPDEVRSATERLYQEKGEKEFRALLAEKDSVAAARIAPYDRQRQIRAYAVVTHTGQTLGYWKSRQKRPLPESTCFEFYLKSPPRDDLYEACDSRFLGMMAGGAVEEVKSMMQRNLDDKLPALKTLGYRNIAAYLRQEITLNEAISAAQQATRNYAKRQMTWFRNQWADQKVINNPFE